MKRAALIRHLLAHGAVLRASSSKNELYSTAKGDASIPLRPEIDELVVANSCKALEIPLPRGIRANPRRPVIRRERIVIQAPPGSTVVIKTPRDGARPRKRKSRA